MIFNVSYNNRKIKDEIIDRVGKPLSFREKLGGRYFGSQRLLIIGCSPDIERLLRLDNNLDHCNIELRKRGIILRFRSILNTYGWVVPYDQLSVNRHPEHYELRSSTHFVKLRAAHFEPLRHGFFDKLSDLKHEHGRQP